MRGGVEIVLGWQVEQRSDEEVRMEGARWGFAVAATRVDCFHAACLSCSGGDEAPTDKRQTSFKNTAPLGTTHLMVGTDGRDCDCFFDTRRCMGRGAEALRWKNPNHNAGKGPNVRFVGSSWSRISRSY